MDNSYQQIRAELSFILQGKKNNCTGLLGACPIFGDSILTMEFVQDSQE
jgi:hypothetical protein